MEENKKNNIWITFGVVLLGVLCGLGLGSGGIALKDHLENGYKQIGVKYWSQDEAGIALMFGKDFLITENTNESELISTDCIYKDNKVYVDKTLFGEFTDSETFTVTIEYTSFYSDQITFIIIN